MNNPYRLSLTLGIVLALAASALAQSKDDKKASDPAQFAPADALVYFGIDDVKDLWADVQKTAAYKLSVDASAKGIVPTTDFISIAIEQVGDRIAKSLDTTRDQLKNPFAGPMAVYAAVQKPSDPNSAYVGIVAKVGDKELMKKYYDTAVAKLKESTKYETDKAGEFSIDVFKTDPDKKSDPNSPGNPDDLASPDFPTQPGDVVKQALNEVFKAESLPPSMAACLAGDTLVVADSPESVRSILNRDKSGKSLADTDDYKAIERQLKPVGPVKFLFNLPAILELAKAEAGSDGGEEHAQMMKVLGGEGLRSAVGHMRIGAQSFDSKLDLLFLMSGERSGLAKILSMENKPVAPPAGTTRDNCMFASVNLDVPKLVDEVERMMRQADPESADGMRKSMEAFQMPNGETVNVRQEVIDKLAAPLAFSMEVAQPVAPGAVRLLLTLGHRDQASLARFLGNFAPMLTPKEIGGQQAFSIAMAPGFTIVPTNDRLLAGSDAAVQAATQTQAGEPLSESDAWRKAARLVPSDAWLVWYSDNRKTFESAIGMAKKLAEGPGAPDAGTMMLMMMVEGVPKDKLDSASKLLSYMAPQVITAATTDAGVQFTVVTLKPAEK